MGFTFIALDRLIWRAVYGLEQVCARRRLTKEPS